MLSPQEVGELINFRPVFSTDQSYDKVLDSSKSWKRVKTSVF